MERFWQKALLFFTAISLAAPVPSICQTFADVTNPPVKSSISGGNAFPQDPSQIASNSGSSAEKPHHGLIGRSIRRGLEDQKEIYSAPFKVSNLKWDALVLATTGGLIAADHPIERNLPNSNYNSFNTLSNASLGTLSGSLVVLWAYGIKTDNPHAKETGELELETLVDTFLVYTPMQLLAGRQRPGEGTNSGNFWEHHSINTSFPAGHPMFTMAMATVVAHEYPKPWVEALAYGAAGAVTAGRLLGHDHWSSDIFIGNVLGYLIARHVFHAHCDPDLSEACHK